MPAVQPSSYTRIKMNHETSHQIAVQIETDYIENQSSPAKHRFVFSYTITIRNDGTEAAKLVNRHWIITDANGKVQEVRGQGVVGEQPHLEPGETFRYTSGTILDTPVGSMQGSYDMVDNLGNHFDALIPAFSLARPGSLH